jgi:hypothetical protein
MVQGQTTIASATEEPLKISSQLLLHFLWRTSQFQIGFHTKYYLSWLRSDELDINSGLQAQF